MTFDDNGMDSASLLRKPHFLADDRRLAAMIHVFAWERTCVGPSEDWPIELAGMTGTELARMVLDSYPGISVLVVSGYADTGAFAPDIPHLTKPFYSDDLTALLLDPAPPAPACQPDPG